MQGGHRALLVIGQHADDGLSGVLDGIVAMQQLNGLVAIGGRRRRLPAGHVVQLAADVVQARAQLLLFDVLHAGVRECWWSFGFE